MSTTSLSLLQPAYPTVCFETAFSIYQDTHHPFANRIGSIGPFATAQQPQQFQQFYRPQQQYQQPFQASAYLTVAAAAHNKLRAITEVDDENEGEEAEKAENAFGEPGEQRGGQKQRHQEHRDWSAVLDKGRKGPLCSRAISSASSISPPTTSSSVPPGSLTAALHFEAEEEESEGTRALNIGEDEQEPLVIVTGLDLPQHPHYRADSSSSPEQLNTGAIESKSSAAPIINQQRFSATSPPSAVAAAGADGTSGKGPGPTDDAARRQQHQHLSMAFLHHSEQLSPNATSITSQVQRVSIEDGTSSLETTGQADHHSHESVAGREYGDEGSQTPAEQRQQQQHHLSKKFSPDPGRPGRAALRKHAAVEDEEQPLGLLLDHQPTASMSATTAVHHQHLQSHAHHHQQQHHQLVGQLQISPLGITLHPTVPSQSSCSSSLPSISPLLTPEQQQLLFPQIAAAAAAAAVAASSISPQSQQSATQQPLDSGAAAALQLALLQYHQQQQQHIPATSATIKHEPISREELISTLVQQQQQTSRDQQYCSWLSNVAVTVGQQQQHQATMNALASLSALIQHNNPAPAVLGVDLLREREQQQQQPLSVDVAHQQCATSTVTTITRLAAIQEEQQHPGIDHTDRDNVSRMFESRNQSTESTASTSGASIPSAAGTMTGGSGGCVGPVGGNEQIPRKQDIQTDIRMNRGRFQLVRKRGRSEVWNLFGQVVDNLTGNRLPYVACYACKVLYTDTGGGTGNMTRHRCSMGSSYRSRRSSSETIVGSDPVSVNQSASFDSIAASAVYFSGPTSPPLADDSSQQQDQAPPPIGHQQSGSSVESEKAWSGVGARAAFAQSGSSGFVSGSTTSAGSCTIQLANMSSNTSLESSTATPQYQPLTLNLAGAPGGPMVSRLLAAAVSAAAVGGGGLSSSGASSSTALSLPNHYAGGSSSSAATTAISPGVLSTPLPPALGYHHYRPPLPVLGSGHHFTQADKQLFAHAVMQFCAQDMHNWDVVEGEGFKNLMETVLFIGRRSHGDPSANTYDPVRNLILSAKQLEQVFIAQEKAVLRATAIDLDQVKGIGLSLNCQTLHFAGERHFAISANYITDDWRITRRIIRVEKGIDGRQQQQQIGRLLAELFQDYQLFESKQILLTLDSDFDGIALSSSFDNMLVLDNAICALNRILQESLAECPDLAHISVFVALCFRAIDAVSVADRIGQFPMVDALQKKIKKDNSNSRASEQDFTNGVYLAVKFIKEHCAEVVNLLEREGVTGLAQKLRQINWKAAIELELFLEPFYEAAQMFQDSKQPHFQRVLPEWYALMHECQPQQSLDESSSSISMGTSVNIEAEDMEDVQQRHQIEGQQSMATTLLTTASTGTPSWLRSVRKAANRRLKEWANEKIRVEHRIATVLNPRLRQLPLICSDAERAVVYERIRELVGLSKPKRSTSSVGAGTKSEPFKKRRRFLDQLEDCALEEEDELDCYLRTSFTTSQTREILEFWSSIGEFQFPRLARLARFLLATSGAPAPIPMQQPSSGKLTPKAIGTLLNLRPEVLNSVNHQLAHQKVQHQRHHHQPDDIHHPPAAGGTGGCQQQSSMEQ